MNVAIVGSRGYRDIWNVVVYVKNLPPDSVVVSGGARGVDHAAEQAAKNRGLRTLIFPADWKKHGKAAGFMRNHDIVNACDRMIAFWDGSSHGTKHSIDLAHEAGKPVEIVR